MPTDEIHAIGDQLTRAHHGDAWYGASTTAVLAGVTAEQASARPLPNAHTIWEIVLHMTGWQREVVRRLRTGITAEPEGGDWSTPPSPTDEAWRASLDALDAAHRDLLAEVERFPPDALADLVGINRNTPLGSGVSYYVLLHGIIQHNIAHTAQISLLKKALSDARPAVH